MNSRRWIMRVAAGACLAFAFCCVFVPEALAFPYHRRVGNTDVYAERPIPDAIAGVIGRADALVHASPIYDPAGFGRRLFLTDGGWRWSVLAARSSGAFAISRPISEAIVVNRSDVTRDLVLTDAPDARTRSLSGVIAHERTHGLIRHHFGLTADMTYPAWLREGYCDYVAGGGSLSDAEARALEKSGRSVPALLYWQGRQRVTAALRANGGSVDRLFADAR